MNDDGCIHLGDGKLEMVHSEGQLGFGVGGADEPVKPTSKRSNKMGDEPGARYKRKPLVLPETRIVRRMDGDGVVGSRMGISLPVPNVQELAADTVGSGEIPSRYLRPEAESEPVISVRRSELPVIDLSRLLDPMFHQEESAHLVMACEEWGFFQLINHGIPEEVIADMKNDVQEFFKLPLKEKQAYAQLPNSVEGYGQAFVASEEQKLDWADMMYIITRPPGHRDMRFWPTHPPTFRDTLDRYSAAVKEAAVCLLGLMARGVGVDEDVILSRFKEQPQTMRINYYPPCPKASTVLGLSPHTDATGLTLLLQVSEAHGLQVRKDGKWVPVEVLPGALIANVGDVLEVMSNGRFKSIEHRATIDSKYERLSIAAFHNPSDRVMVGPLAEFVQDGEKKYKSMSYKDYLKAFFSAKLDGRGMLEKVKLAN